MDDNRLEAQNHTAREQPNGTSNGQKFQSRDGQSKKYKSKWESTIINFSAQWFALPMSTGILAIIMHLLPYQFHGLPVLATIMFVLDIILFVLVSILFIIKWTVYPHTAVQKTAGNLDEIGFFGAAPISFLTITALVGIIVSNSYWGGHAWMLVAYVMWWFGMIWMFITCKSTGTSLRIRF